MNENTTNTTTEQYVVTADGVVMTLEEFLEMDKD